MKKMEFDRTKSYYLLYYDYRNCCSLLCVAFNLNPIFIINPSSDPKLFLSSSFSSIFWYSHSQSHLSLYNNISSVYVLLTFLFVLNVHHMRLKFLSFFVFFPTKIGRRNDFVFILFSGGANS